MKTMMDTTPAPHCADPLELERWFVTSLLEKAIELGREPQTAITVALIFAVRRNVALLRRELEWRRGPLPAELPPALVQVCRELLGRSLSRDELEFAFEVYRDRDPLALQITEAKIIRAIVPGLPGLHETGAQRVWQVLDENRH